MFKNKTRTNIHVMIIYSQQYHTTGVQFNVLRNRILMLWFERLLIDHVMFSRRMRSFRFLS